MKKLFLLIVIILSLKSHVFSVPYAVSDPGCVEYSTIASGLVHGVTFTPAGPFGYPNPSLRNWYYDGSNWIGPVFPSYFSNGKFYFLIPNSAFNQAGCIEVVTLWGVTVGGTIYDPPYMPFQDSYKVCKCQENDRCNSNFSLSLYTENLGQSSSNFNYDVMLKPTPILGWINNTPLGQPDRFVVYRWQYNDPNNPTASLVQYSHASMPIPISHTYSYLTPGTYNICLNVALAQVPPNFINNWQGFYDLLIDPNQQVNYSEHDVCNTCLSICINHPESDGSPIDNKSNNKVDNSDNNIQVYPNPANKEINISINNLYEKNVTIKLIDILGNCHFNKKYNNVLLIDEKINTSKLSSGNYSLLIDDNNEIKVKVVTISK